MRLEDIVVAYSKKTIFGIGRVKGPYYSQTNDPRARILGTNNVVNAIRDFVVIKYIQDLMKDLNS